MYGYHTLKKFWLPATLSYIALIVVVNVAFSVVPFIHILGNEASPMDAFVGVIYLVRDFAQRELRHYVLLAMLIGLMLSSLLAAHEVAFASAAAFATGELVDWLIFSFTRKPLSQRLLWSACISTPIDSSVFLLCVNQLNLIGFLLMTTSKFIGVWLIWLAWRRKNKHAML